MTVKSGTMKELQLSLARWQNPSAWDRISQDEPLDPVEGKWLPTVATATTQGTITIPVGTTFTTDTGTLGTLLITLGSAMSEMARTIDRDVFQMLEKMGGLGKISMGTSVGQEGLPDTWIDGNRPVPVLQGNVPYPRNRKEQRIWKSIGKHLPEVVKRVSAKLGSMRDTVTSDEWNAEFWKVVTIQRKEREP